VQDRKATIEVLGGGTLRDCGRPVSATETLSTRALSGVVDYQPDELMLTVRPGTTLHEIDILLAKYGQCLLFEPTSYAPLYGKDPAKTTIGGVVGANLSGPRRFRSGAARDHILAVRGVGARGEVFKGGGKVVKNVTGYDIPKLIAGAYGTLAIATELTLKVMPRARAELTVLCDHSDLTAALQFMRDIAASRLDATGIALLALPGISTQYCVAIRLQGYRDSVIERASKVSATARHAEGEESALIWREVATPINMASNSPDDPLWLVTATPTECEDILQAAAPEKFIVDHAGGRMFLYRPPSDWQPAAGQMNALLLRAPETSRASHNTGGPFTDDVKMISGRIKAQFDPAGLLNPGRLMANIA
jgi:glycolate oxidase FAD binding subunit